MAGIETEISFYALGVWNLFVEDLNSTIESPINAVINFPGDMELLVEFLIEPTIYPVANGRIYFQNSLEMVAGFYGLTIPFVNELSISFDCEVLMATSTVFPFSLEVLDSGSIYELINNTITLPSSLEVSIVGNAVEDEFVFIFLNAIESEIYFNFLNALNVDLSTSFLFKNILTDEFTLSLIFLNRILAVNEVEQSFGFLNRLSGGEVSEVYDGFYFSKIHGM